MTPWPVRAPRQRRPSVGDGGRLTRADRREALLDAAAALVAAGEVQAVSMETVADRAGVSRSLVYKYFLNRGDLLAAVYRREATLLHRELAAEVGAATTVEGMFRTLIRGACCRQPPNAVTSSARCVQRAAGVTSCAVSNAVAMSKPSGPSRDGRCVSSVSTGAA